MEKDSKEDSHFIGQKIESTNMPKVAEVAAEKTGSPAPVQEKESICGTEMPTVAVLPSRKRPLRNISKGRNGVGASSNGTSPKHSINLSNAKDNGTTLSQDDHEASSDSSNSEFDIDIVLPSTSAAIPLSDQSASKPIKFQSIDAVPLEARPMMPVIYHKNNNIFIVASMFFSYIPSFLYLCGM